MHHLKRAACETEGHRPQGVLACPIGNRIERGPRREDINNSSNKSAVIRGNSYRTYCIAFPAFSWLGSGTSFRSLPDAESWLPWLWRSSALADLFDEVDIKAAGCVRGRHGVKSGRAAICERDSNRISGRRYSSIPPSARGAALLREGSMVQALPKMLDDNVFDNMVSGGSCGRTEATPLVARGEVKQGGC